VLNNIYLKTLRDMRRALLWWGVGMFVFSLWMITLFPSIEESSVDIQNYVDSFPESFRAFFATERLDFSTLEGFITMELLSIFYPVLILAFAVSYGAGLLGGEEESGTLEILLSMPVPRWRVMVDQFAALVTFILIVLLATWLGIVAGILVVGIEDADLLNLLAGILNMAPLALFFGALAYCLTGVRGGKGTALGVTLALAAATYLMHTLSETASLPGWMQTVSPWYYYDGLNVLIDGVDPFSVGLLLGLALLLVAVGIFAFERRDVGV